MKYEDIVTIIFVIKKHNFMNKLRIIEMIILNLYRYLIN